MCHRYVFSIFKDGTYRLFCTVVTGLVQFGILVQSTTPDSNISTAALNSWATANVSLSVTTTVLSTVMIVTRIWTANLSLGVIEVFIESAALYAIASLIYIGISEPTTHATDVRYLYAQILFSTAAVSRPFRLLMHSESNSLSYSGCRSLSYPTACCTVARTS